MTDEPRRPTERASADDLSMVYGTRDAEKEAAALGLTLADIGGTLLDSWKRRITSGSRLKSLRHVPGNDYRLRQDKIRVVFSVVGRAAYIHLVGRRDDVYRDDAFGIKLARFHEQRPGDHALQDSGAQALGYHPLVPRGAPIPSDAPIPSIGYLPRPNQRLFFDRVFPIEKLGTASDPRLTIGYGPPGSGKTIVGCELAMEALEDGHRVDVLVPTRSLESRYKEALSDEAAHLVSAHGDEPGIRILRFDSCFATRAGRAIDAGREADFINWIRARLDEPPYRSRLASQSIRDRRNERLPVLADALLEDDEWWGVYDRWNARGKDPIVEPLKPFLANLKDLRDRLLDDLDYADDLLSRGRLATLPPAPAAVPRARLIIVDEAQDLAPAEWRTLLRDAFLNNGDFDQRIVLLGDLQQRVSMVPFSWADIKDFATASTELAPREMVDLQVDSASYRMRQEIGRAARAVFSREVSGNGPGRRAGILDIQSLPCGGTVQVAVLDGSAPTLDHALTHLPDGKAREDGYLFVIHGRSARGGSRRRDDVFNFSIKEAKGLEADRIIVNLPFGMPEAGRPERVIGHDEATEFYTAMSRARDRVLLLVDARSWASLARAGDAWSGADLRMGAQITEAWLRDALRDSRIGLDPEEAVKQRLRQMEQAVNDTTLAPEELAQTVSEVLTALSLQTDQGLCLGAALELMHFGSELADLNRAAYIKLRSGLTAPGKLEGSAKTALLVFLGELALALRQAEALSKEAAAGWQADLVELLLDDKPLQMYRLNNLDPAGKRAWTDEALERWLLASALAAFRRGTRGPSLPANAPAFLGPLSASVGPSRNASSSAADAIAARRFTEVQSRIRSLMVAEEEEAIRVVAQLVAEAEARRDQSEKELRQMAETRVSDHGRRAY